MKAAVSCNTPLEVWILLRKDMQIIAITQWVNKPEQIKAYEHSSIGLISFFVCELLKIADVRPKGALFTLVV